ncbi:hypothetical protein DSM3645_02538 [Blastopirellula marina DSM 3645]|uniref:Uncharacterized protein n=1 Tax=Blastopirellula marina DSM 3645 TaxID=314230 RepID=A3ZVH1_9BACT|nr:hypothetical protein DSM3645_02538 [Blastopirellula marina DSM 3645]
MIFVIGVIWWIASCFKSKPKGLVIKGHSHTTIEPKR